MNEPSADSPINSSGSKALRNVAIVVVILLLFSPIRLLALPFLTLAAVVWGLRRLWRWNRMLGMTATSLVVAAVSVYAVLYYLEDQKDQRLLAELPQYKHVTLDCDFLPFPRPARLSVETPINDEKLAAILKLERIEMIDHLDLKSSRLTDACLQNVAALPNLKRVFLDCDGISDEAIIALEQQLPDCQVLAFQRNLHPDSGISVKLGPLRD